MKNQTKLQKNDDESGPVELLEKPREYMVRFRFPETSQLQPPILGLYNVNFNYSGQIQLFKNVEFGIDMESRIAIGKRKILFCVLHCTVCKSEFCRLCRYYNLQNSLLHTV